MCNVMIARLMLFTSAWRRALWWIADDDAEARTATASWEKLVLRGRDVSFRTLSEMTNTN